MIFNYYLDSYGYAGIIFENDNFKRNYTIEYCLGDNLYELLEGIIALTKYKKDHKIGDDINTKCVEDRYKNNHEDLYEWITDVGSSKAKFIFKLTEVSEIINLKIIEDDIDGERVVFENELNFYELIDNILDSCYNILNKYGILGYYLNFWIDFPISYYLMLKDFRKKKIKFDKINEFINDDTDMHRSNFDDEIEYLIKK